MSSRVDKAFIKKHLYYNTNMVYVKGDLSTEYPCFALSFGDTRFALKSVMSKEDADKYLKMIADEEPFKWWWEGDYVQFKLSSGKKEYMILLGNLCKGISEFSFFCQDILTDKSNDTFFGKSVKAFEKYLPHINELCYATGHGWHQYTPKGKYPDITYYIPEDQKKAWMGLTIKQLFENYRKAKRFDFMGVWKTCGNQVH
jgi:hypothetical protein